MKDILPKNTRHLETYKKLYITGITKTVKILLEEDWIRIGTCMGTNLPVYTCGNSCNCIKKLGTSTPLWISFIYYSTPTKIGIPLIITEIKFKCVTSKIITAGVNHDYILAK